MRNGPQVTDRLLPPYFEMGTIERQRIDQRISSTLNYMC